MKSDLMETLENSFNQSIFISRRTKFGALMSISMAQVQPERGNTARDSRRGARQ